MVPPDQYLYLNSGARPRGPRSPSSLYHPKTPYCRTKRPLEPFWPPRCHLASQSDPRTLKSDCSSLPRGHQCAPKWLSEPPQSRRGPRKCCSRSPRSCQCIQKCCPGLLQSRQSMQKHSPSLHHSEENCSFQLPGRFAIKSAARNRFCASAYFWLFPFSPLC